MDNIIIKQVMDTNGRFSHLELWQGSNHIELSLASTCLDVQESSSKWSVLKSQIDNIADSPATASLSSAATIKSLYGLDEQGE